MKIKDWIPLQNTSDTLSLVRLALTKPGTQTGTTPPDVQSVYDKWQKAKVKTLKQVADLAGLAKADLASPAELDAKFATWIDGLATAGKLTALRRLPLFWMALYDYLDDGLDMDEDATQDVGSKPTFAPPIAVTENWTALIDPSTVSKTNAGDVVEAIMRGELDL